MLQTNFCEMAAQYLDTHESPDEATRNDFLEAVDYYICCQHCSGARGALFAAASTVTKWSKLDIVQDCLRVQKFFVKYYIRVLARLHDEPDEFCP